VRILLVTPYYAPAYAFGGPVFVTESIARAVVAAGHELTVATTDALDGDARVPADAAAVPPAAEVLRFANVHHGLAARAMGWTPRGFRGWVRDNAGAFDVVHLNDIYSVLSVAAARAARDAGVPYVVQPHGSTAVTRARGRSLVKRAFLAAWGRRTLTEASAILASTATEHADQIAAGVSAQRIADIPPPLDLPVVHERAPLPERPTLVFLGRFHAIKGLDGLLHAAALARREVPQLRVVLVGAGDPLQGELERLARRLELEVEFPGFLDGEAKVRALQAAHAFCLLSRSEGLPVAALEAMACGTPAILSEACNLPEVHEHAGLVVSADQEAAAAAMVRLLSDAALRERLSAGAEAFAQDFHADTVLPRLLALYEDLASATSTSPPA
jgi:glycosyltransferase involved in cell wall biosynthesis